ncbi:NAD(P)H nitroreductase [Amorphoplanes nipponensis]|uniref:NAD(P)H nitroreductase n=1 Tax=Actinoplanes nipponensis TaxID=135950 RepID=A0A919JRH8_9ACTN|nr:nitroreductase [Actinoplanes nipponensis]GIE54107.1 NAD(P)H nitroreductase [Actinoplanes nipponensis]
MTASSDHVTATRARAAFEAAARTSLRAPSVFNTQPWRWRILGDALELRADPGRRLESTDPDGTLMLLSCGAALHHARTALAAAGWTTTVERLPDPDQPDLMARLRLGRSGPVDPEARVLAAAIPRRRTDRRAFGPREVPAATLDRLRRVVEREGAGLHVLREDQTAMLAVSTDLAATAELDDPDYRAELHEWTHRPDGSGDGVPLTTAVRPGLRRVPVRDFAPDEEGELAAGEGRDRGASYVIVYGIGYRPIDLLLGGEALSALLLRATAEGLATAPLSDAVEVTWPRHLLRYLVSGLGEPYVAVRLGYAGTAEPLPPAPRRDPAEVIEVVPARP